MKPPPPTDFSFRLGSAAIGLVVGVLIGFVCAGAELVVFDGRPLLPRCAFGGAAIGALMGLVLPSLTWFVIEGSVHFLLGMLGFATDDDLRPSRHAPMWLKVLLWLGIAAGAWVSWRG